MNDKEKLEAIIEVIEKLDKLCNTKINDYNRSPEVEDFENAIYDMRKILGILWKDQKSFRATVNDLRLTNLKKFTIVAYV